MISYNTRSLRRTIALGLVSIISIVGSSHASNESPEFIKGLFARVQFDAQPDAIVLKQSLKSEGRVEVRFRDTNHLRSIFETIPEVDAEELCFVRDPEAYPGFDLAYLKEGVVRSSFIQICVSQPIIPFPHNKLTDNQRHRPRL